MEPEHQITFGPFRLETPQGHLWRGDQRIPLRPRSLALLHYAVWSKNSNALFSQCLRDNHSQLLALQSTVL